MRRTSTTGKLTAALGSAALAVTLLAIAPTPAHAAQGEITYTLHKSSAPTADELDAYAHIEDAMNRAVGRWNAQADITKHINVYYAPGVPTAEANYNGDLRFGSNRSYMVEGTALHEISHTLGIGQTGGYYAHCDANDWATATPLLRSWDGPDARINCGGGHIWPYGLNYSNEFSDEAFYRHVELIEAMIADGLQS